MGIQAGRQSDRNPSRSTAPARQPITRHPLFPVLVALWFGALFGLGSLAVRTGLIEALVLKLRVDQILPFAAPPLGMKARALLALGMAAAGALAGLWLGRRLRDGGGQASASGGKPGGLAASLKRAVGRDEPAPVVRRRALAVEEEPGDGWTVDLAPLPGGRPQVLSASDYDFVAALPQESAPAQATTARGAETDDEPAPLDLDPFGSDEQADPAPRRFDAPPAAEARPEPQPDCGMSHLDLVNRLAVAMQARRARRAAQPVGQEAAGTAPDEPEAISQPLENEPAGPAPLPRFSQPPAPSPVPSAPAAVPPPMPAALRPLAFDEEDEAPDVSHVPARSIGLSPFAPAASDGPVRDDDEPDAASEELLEEGYSSLLDLSRPAPASQTSTQTLAGQPFVRIEDPEADRVADEPEPLVVFPGQTARPFDAPAAHAPAAHVPAAPAAIADREETERALRTALATLQRMSGAA